MLQKQRAPLARAGLFNSKSIESAAYFGAEESLLVEDLLVFFLWVCFLLWVDLAGAEADEFEEGAVVSAANTGPAANANRQTTGTSFLNIERLHCKKKRTVKKSVLQDARLEACVL
jgi:hypothetical protein